MVIKGSARASPGELAHHLLREDTNETVQVLELNGVASLTLPGALAELDGIGAGSRSARTLYHASINTPVVEQLTPEQQRIARLRLAEELGLTEQPFAVVEHVKHGRQHTHIVWSRIDVETGKAIPDSHNYRKHETVSRELEMQFGHTPVPGAHVRDKLQEPRPERGPTWGELRQAERSGLTLQEAKRQITELWQHTKTGSEFTAALTGEGWSLARGDRRDFVLFDHTGEMHSLRLRLDGVRAAQIRERMADVDADQLPTVDQAKQQRARQVPVIAQPPSAVVSIDEQRPQIETDKQQERPTAAAEPEQEIYPAQPTPILPTVDSAARDPRPEKARDQERRPSAALFVQLFGIVIDAYQRAIDRGIEILSAKKTPPPPASAASPEIKPKSRLEWFRPSDRKGPKPGF